MKKPIIGITLDIEEKGGYSNHRPWYALRDNYFNAVALNGGCPIALPHNEELVEQYISMIDGLIVPGGDFDIDPKMYGQNIMHGTRNLRPSRIDFESKMIEESINANLPVLGICSGQQLMAVMYGGELIQDIPAQVKSKIQHEQSKENIPHDKPAHKIIIEKGSLLHKLVNTEEMMVNSTHHQAAKSVGNEMIISAKAEDGIIEAIELKDYPFCIGVEWHPEYEISKEDSAIIEGLVNAARK